MSKQPIKPRYETFARSFRAPGPVNYNNQLMKRRLRDPYDYSDLIGSQIENLQRQRRTEVQAKADEKIEEEITEEGFNYD